ncbi:MAG: cache domain-containing protein [Cyanobacteria bacterium J06641_5]
MKNRLAPSGDRVTADRRSLLSSVQFKVMGIAILLGTLPVLVTGVAAYQVVKSETRQQVEALHQNLATGLHNKINIFMRDRYGDIQVMSGLDIFTAPKLQDIVTVTDKRVALERLQKAYPIYSSIGLFDRNGNVIAQTSGEALGNHSDRRFVKAALERGKPVISQPTLSKTLGTFNIYSAAPIEDKVSGQTIGFICAHLPVSSFGELISSLGADEANQYFLSDRDGNIFFSSDEAYPTETNSRDGVADSNTTPQSLQQFFPQLEDLQTRASPGSVLGTSSAAGKKQLLITYIPSKALEGLPALGWGVTLATNTDDAFATQQPLLETLVGGTTLAMIFVALIAVILADRATRPILSATTTVTQLGQGQLGARVAVRGTDEIAQLGANINQMAERIQALVAEIESSNAAEIQQQNKLLQSDVGHILGVVTAITEGDLTVKAVVNERATGLLSDTLNCLTEELTRVLAQFSEAVRQVSQSANQQKQLTGVVAENALQQAQAVTQVLDLTGQVKRAASDSETQVRQTTASLQHLEVAVNDGQGALAALNEGISVLEQGSNRIVQQMKALVYHGFNG